MISGAAASKENDAIKAVLHANRSMAHINMVKFKYQLNVLRTCICTSCKCKKLPQADNSNALADGEASISLDSSYVKVCINIYLSECMHLYIHS